MTAREGPRSQLTNSADTPNPHFPALLALVAWVIAIGGNLWMRDQFAGAVEQHSPHVEGWVIIGVAWAIFGLFAAVGSLLLWFLSARKGLPITYRRAAVLTAGAYLVAFIVYLSSLVALA